MKEKRNIVDSGLVKGEADGSDWSGQIAHPPKRWRLYGRFCPRLSNSLYYSSGLWRSITAH